MTCPVAGCTRPRHPNLAICTQHDWQLGRDLHDAPQLAAELELTMSRQRATPSSGGRSADTPLPYDDRASQALATLTRALTLWCRQAGVILRPTDTPAAMAGFLNSRRHHLVTRIDAHEAAQQIGDACANGWRVVQPSSRGRIALPDACPECRAALWATMHDVGDPRPNLVWCDGPERHEWRPEQWLRLGHRLGYGRTA